MTIVTISPETCEIEVREGFSLALGNQECDGTGLGKQLKEVSHESLLRSRD